MVENNPNSIWDAIKNGVFIIAEAGKNFIQTQEEKTVEEYLENAKQLVDAAKKAGASAIKFQTHNVEDEQLDINVVSEHFKSSDRFSWVSRNTRATPIDRFWKPLKRYCDEKGIIFLSTPMSRGAAKILDEVGVKVWKVGSGDILDFVMLDFIRRTDRPIIISSGMSTLEETVRALEYIKEKNKRVALLHCVSKYPCPPEDLRIGTILYYRDYFDVPIGFSDHSICVEPQRVASALGATVFEKHFSLSRDFWGSDHKVSLHPDEFKQMVDAIKATYGDFHASTRALTSVFARRALSQSEKVLQSGEAVFRPLFRKSLMAACDIKAGSIITSDMLYAMRPQKFALGLPSEEYENVVQKIANRDIKRYEPITFDVLMIEKKEIVKQVELV